MMKRLQAISDCLERVAVFADIGCDHGFVSQFVLQNNLAGRLYVCDISVSSLNKARALVGEAGNVILLVSDGFEQIPEKVDLAVIAGMGGLNIMDILSNKTIDVEKLILQPQKNAPQLREYLVKSGYRITRDFTAYERGKYYDILRCERGVMRLDKTALEIGAFYQTKDPLLKQRLLKKIKALKSYKQTDEINEKIHLLTEALKWQE